MKENFHEKLALILSFLILNNYLFLSLSFSQLLIKINYIFFLIFLVVFYFKNFKENPYLKIFFLFIILISLGTPVFEWDPRSNYLFHAKRIFYDQSIFSVADKYASFSHNDYPTLVPAFAASLSTLLGYWNEVFPKLSFSFMFLPPFILTYIFLKDVPYIVFISLVFFIIGKYLFNGWADGIVAVYFCISTLLMYILIISKDNLYKRRISLYIIALCFFISLTLIKNEGIALLSILFFLSFLIILFKKKMKENILKFALLSLSFIPILLWKYFCFTNEIGLNDYINQDIFFNLSQRIYDIGNYKLVGYFLLLNEKFLICLLLFLIAFWINKDNELFIFILSTAIIYIFVLFIIFLSTPYDLYFQLNSTAARVVKSLSFLFAFFALYNLRNNIKNL